MSSPLHINIKKLAKLLHATVVANNKKRKVLLPVKSALVYEQLIEAYFSLCTKEAISDATAVIFPFIGNLTVLQKISKKGWAWDRKYDAKDYELILATDKPVEVNVDKRFYKKIIAAVDRGVEYKNEINYSERLDEILSLMYGRQVAGRRKRIQSQ